MKKIYRNTLILLLILAIIFYAIYTFTQNKSTNSYTRIINTIENNGSVVAVHRVNTPLKIQEVKETYKLNNIEIDVTLHDGVLVVGHDKNTLSKDSLEVFFNHVDSQIPDFEFIWLDLKDLTLETQKIHLDTLNKIDQQYNIKNRVLIESRDPSALQLFSELGWEVGYYLRYDLDQEPLSYFSEVVENLNNFHIESITFDCTYISLALERFGHIQLNNNSPIKLNCWTFKNKKYSIDDFDKLQHIKYLLISLPTRNHL